MTMLVEIISSRAAFATLKDEWNTMPQALCSPLARHEWFAASLDAFSVEDELALFVACSGGTLRAVAPLIIDRSMGSPRLNILGHQTQEPNEFLYTDEDALAAVCAKVMQSGWPAAMHRFYTAFGYAAAQLGIARLYFLRVGEKFIAARFAVSYAGRLWELKIG